MKKAASLLLCLTLLLGLLTTALAKEVSEDGSTEAVWETAIPEEESLTAEEALLPSEEPLPEKLFPMEEEPRDGEGDEAVLMDGTAVVNVTVNFPAEVASASGRFSVYLCRKAEVDGSGRVTAEPVTVTKQLTVSGTNPLVASFTGVSAGEYFLGIYSANLESQGLLRTTYYLNEDGTTAAGMYTATTFAVGEGAAVNRSVTLRQAERSISGTLTFSQPMEEDLELQIYASSSNGAYSPRGSVLVPRGAGRASFSIAAERDVYILYFYSNQKAYYYSIDGELHPESGSRAYMNLRDASVSGLEIDGDCLLNSTARVKLTVKLPEALTEQKQLAVYYMSEDSGLHSSRITLDPGTAGVVRTVSVLRDTPYRFFFADSTNVSSSYGSQICGALYAAEDGITSVLERAKTWSFSGSTGEVTIQEPAWLRITGQLDRGGFLEGKSASLMVSAAFEDEETFVARVVFAPGETRKDYTIYVPASENGKSFSLSAVCAQDGNSNRGDENTRTLAVPGILNGNTSAALLSVSAPLVQVSGSVRLPQGMTAPAGGVAVTVQGNLIEKYIIPAGSSSLDFRFTDCFVGSQSFSVSLEGAAGAASSLDMPGTAENGVCGGLDFAFEKTAMISGKVKLPEGVSDVGATVYFRSGSAYSYASIIQGQREAAYAVEAAVGPKQELSACLQRETRPCLLADWVYVGSDWQYSHSSGNGPAVSGDRSGVDLQLEKAIVLSGMLQTADGSPIEALRTESNKRVSIRLERIDGEYNTAESVTVEDDGSWIAKLKEDSTGEYYLCANVTYSSNLNLVSGKYYFNDAGRLVTEPSEATPVTLTAAGQSGLVIPVRSGWVLRGLLVPDEGGCLTMTNSTSTVTVSAKNAETSYSGSASITSGQGPWSFAVVVPEESDVYSVGLSSAVNSSWNSNILFRAETEAMEVNGDLDGIVITLPVARSVVSGTITRPEGYTEYAGITVRVQMLDGSQVMSEYSGSTSLSGSSSSSSYGRAVYSIQIPQEETLSQYRIRVTVSGSGNALTRDFYLTEGGTALLAGDAAEFSLSPRAAHDFTLPENPPYLSGKIYIPEGVTEPFSLRLYAGDSGSTSIEVDPASCSSDSGGKYCSYALRSSGSIPGAPFTLGYRVNSDSSGLLLKPYSSTTFYLREDGSFGTGSGEARTFLYEGEPLSADLHPLLWDSWNDSYLLQSGHGLTGGTYEYVFRCPEGSTGVILHFAFADCYATVNGSYRSLNGSQIIVNGEQAVITLNLSEGGTYYGFGVDEITVLGTPAEAAALSVYTESGTDPASILSDARAGKTLTAVLSGETEEPEMKKALAAAYADDGRFLGAELAEAALSAASPAAVRFRFDSRICGEIDELKLLLLDSGDMIPEMRQVEIGLD